MATVVGVSVRTPVPSRMGARLGDIMRPALFIMVASLAVLVGGSAASAQPANPNSLQSITPEDGTSLEDSPTSIVLVFNQELAEDDAVTVNLSCSFQPQATSEPEVDADRTVVTTTIDTVLPEGRVCHRLVAQERRRRDTPRAARRTSRSRRIRRHNRRQVSTDDSSVTTTTDPFIRQTVDDNDAGTASEPVDQGSTGGALWFGRLLSTLGILVVFGGLVLISVGWPEGPEYVVTVRFLRAAWILAMVGTVLYLVAYSADFNGTSLGAAMSPGEWLAPQRRRMARSWRTVAFRLHRGVRLGGVPARADHRSAECDVGLGVCPGSR